MPKLLLPTTLVALALLAPAATGACKQESPEVTTPLVVFYVDHDPCPDCSFSLWIYQESNGMAGLQRGDEVTTSCDAGEEPDTIIW